MGSRRDGPLVGARLGHQPVAERVDARQLPAARPPHEVEAPGVRHLAGDRPHQAARLQLAGHQGGTGERHAQALRRRGAAPGVLVEGGWLVAEMGAGQAEAVRERVAADGRYARWWTIDDLAGIPRVLAA